MRWTGTKLWLAISLIAVSPNVAFAASSITGTITFAGTPPAMKPVDMAAAPSCAKKHTTPTLQEMLVLGKGNTMGNILVFVSKGLPSGKTYPAPSAPAVLDQKGCKYEPHVQGIMVGQAYKILNSDGILHNVHALPKINKQFNMPMPANRKEASATFDKPEPVFKIKCDVHPWMEAYVAPYTHPFFAVTGADGKFTIPNLEPGTYEITAWHERLPAQTATVVVPATGSKTQDFKFSVGAVK